MNIIICVLLVCFFILIIWKAEPAKPLTGLREDYLAIDSCCSVRGIGALTIVLHHLSKTMETVSPINGFFNVGYLVVSMFFFFSGYGLQKSYVRNGSAYSEKFLLKRVPKVLIPYLIMIVLYCAVYILNGDVNMIRDSIEHIKYGALIVSYSWYIIICLAFYIAYGIMMKICGEKYNLMLALGVIFWIVDIIIIRIVGFGMWWYNATQMTVLGMFWALYDDRLLKYIKKFYVPLVIVLTAAFAVSFHVMNSCVGIINIACSIFSSTVFTLLLICIMLKVKFKNRVLDFLGKISLEIYLSQGIFIYLFRSGRIYISNDGLYVLLSATATVACAFLLNKMFTVILNKYKKLIA